MGINVDHPTARFFLKGDFRPMTNAERQAEFRRRNPGYYQRLHAQRRAALKARMAQRKEAERAAVMAMADAQAMPEPVTLTIPVPTFRLALPAPVVDPAVLAIDALAAKLVAQKLAPHADPVPVPLSAQSTSVARG